MVPDAEKAGLRHSARHSDDARRVCVLWNAAHSRGRLDKSRAQAIWASLARLPLDESGIADLVHCCWMYGFALAQRAGHRSAGTAKQEKETRRKARQLAKEARDLESSMSVAIRDPRVWQILADAFVTEDKWWGACPRFPGLRVMLTEFARAIEVCLQSHVDASKPLETQSHLAHLMRKAAMCGDPTFGMRGMVPLFRSRAGRVQWRDLASLVNFMWNHEIQFDWLELKRDYRDLKRS